MLVHQDPGLEGREMPAQPGPSMPRLKGLFVQSQHTHRLLQIWDLLLLHGLSHRIFADYGGNETFISSTLILGHFESKVDHICY